MTEYDNEGREIRESDDEIHAKRAKEYRDTEQNNIFYKKLMESHQNNEYLRVNNYKEALCYVCMKKDVATATLVDICLDCKSKRGQEVLLAQVTYKYSGLCFFCGQYKFHLSQINCRLCMSCNARVRKILTAYNMGGGNEGTNPFYKWLKHKHGKDWKILFSDPNGKLKWTRK